MSPTRAQHALSRAAPLDAAFSRKYSSVHGSPSSALEYVFSCPRRRNPAQDAHTKHVHVGQASDRQAASFGESEARCGCSAAWGQEAGQRPEAPDALLTAPGLRPAAASINQQPLSSARLRHPFSGGASNGASDTCTAKGPDTVLALNGRSYLSGAVASEDGPWSLRWVETTCPHQPPRPLWEPCRL